MKMFFRSMWFTLFLFGVTSAQIAREVQDMRASLIVLESVDLGTPATTDSVTSTIFVNTSAPTHNLSLPHMIICVAYVCHQQVPLVAMPQQPRHRGRQCWKI
jgi:hypothetical protein